MKNTAETKLDFIIEHCVECFEKGCTQFSVISKITNLGFSSDLADKIVKISLNKLTERQS